MHRPTTSVLLAALALIALTGHLETSADTALKFGPYAAAWFVQSHPLTCQAIVLMALLMFVISGRIAFSTLATVFVCAITAYASTTKLRYLGTPLTLADLRFFVADLRENVVLFAAYPNLGVLLAGTLLATLATLAAVLKLESGRGLRARLTAGIALSLMTGCFAWAQQLEPADAALADWTESSATYSVSFAFRHLTHQQVMPHTGIGDLLEIFLSDATVDFQKPARTLQTRFKPSSHHEVTAADRPDIFAVLEESTFNPRMLENCKHTQLCNSPLFEASHAHQEYGPLFVHTAGGGTWLSEFTFLSGFDWRIFGPGGARAPLNLSPRMQTSLPKHLKSLGYQTIAIYPVEGNYLNARQAYRHYGFDLFLATEELGLKNDWLATRDDLLFSKALERLATMRDGRPVFIFLLTIRNHGPHAETPKDLPPALEPELARLPPPLADYLHRMRESELAMKQLSEQWLAGTKPRVILWFGDHQPVFAAQAKADADYARKYFARAPTDTQLRYTTWYSMASNTARPSIPQPVERSTDIAYLGTRLLAFSGLPARASDAATATIQTICPQGIVPCDDTKAVSDYVSFRIWDMQEIL